MDPNNYFSAFLPPQYSQQQQQQIPVEHLIANNQQQQQQYFNNNLFATNSNNNIIPTLTPIIAAGGGRRGGPAATTCYIPNGDGSSAAAVVGPSFFNNNNNFGGNISSLSNSTSSFSLQQPTLLPASTSSHLPFQQQQQPQPFLQISLSPSIPQPIAVIIDGQQYLEFPSTNPAEQSQFIPLQLFLQPQNYISQSSSTAAEIFPQPIVAPNFSTLSNPPPILPQPMSLRSPNQLSVLNSTQNLSNLQPQIVKMDTTAISNIVSPSVAPATSTPTISPPTKTRRTKSPQKRISNENFKTTPQTQSSLHKFFSTTSSASSSAASTMNSTQQNIKSTAKEESDDEIQVLDEKIKSKYSSSEYDDVQFVEMKPSPISNGSEPPKAVPKKRNNVSNIADKSTVMATPNITPSNSQPSSAAAASAPSNKRTINASANRLSSFTSANNQVITLSSDKPASGALTSRPNFMDNEEMDRLEMEVANDLWVIAFIREEAEKRGYLKTSSKAPFSSSSSTTTTTTTTRTKTKAASTPSASGASSTAPVLYTSSTTSNTTPAASSTTSSATPAADRTDATSLESPDPIEQRLQTRSSLNSRISPTFDYKMTTDIIREIVPIILEVIPNAIINGIGPAYHECGSFLNLAFDEETRQISYIWFFFSLSIMIGDKQKKELQTPDEKVLEMWIKEIETKFHEADIVQHSNTRTQRGAQKLIFEHKRINAKITLLFCAEDACKRSQIIRLYTRFHTRIPNVAYLYNNMIISDPSLHLFTNTPLCYMIIYFLQQTNRTEVIHQSTASTLIDKINLFQPPDYRTEDICHLIKPATKHANDSVAVLAYEFAKFYSTFDYDKIIIDISQKERRYWLKKDEGSKKPIAVRCCFSGRNLASQVTALCLSTFQKKMKEVVAAFKAENEATVFPSDLEDFAKKI